MNSETQAFPNQIAVPEATTMSKEQDRINKAKDMVSRCEKCEMNWLPFGNYLWRRTGKRVLLCKNCAIEYEYEIEKIVKLSKKERRRLKKLRLTNLKNVFKNGKQENTQKRGNDLLGL